MLLSIPQSSSLPRLGGEIVPTYLALRPEYAELWATVEIKPGQADIVSGTAQKIIANRDRYRQIEEATTVPWYVVGIIHMLECGGSFKGHLHNGDPLTGKTKNVPKGRPAGNAPFSWEASAVDALCAKPHELQKVGEWSIPRIAYELERYNGWGYRKPRRPASPYLWSRTNHYTKGKYIADGRYSANVISQQSGGMAILKALMTTDPEITPDADGLTDAQVYPKTECAPSDLTASWTIRGAGIAIVAKAGEYASGMLDVAKEASTETQQSLDGTKSLLTAIGANAGLITTLLVIGACAVVIARRVQAHKQGKIG